MGYVQAYREMMEQLQTRNSSVEAIFLPTGTGTTQAGLIYGNKMAENEIDVIGITVARPVERCKQEILCLLGEMNRINNTGYSFSESEIIIMDNGGIPYGTINESVIETMRLLAYTDGVLLDPIYNAKTFHQMENLIKTDYHNKYRNVLYLNTGGTPNIFTAEMARKVN